MKYWVLALGLMVGSWLNASPVLVRSVSPNTQLGVIPFQEYRLSNGMRLILHEDHRNPIVHVQVMYHVGSARETPGKTGFAHFFEHMMFQGSKHVPYNKHFEIVTQAGGRMNGSASRDRTNYYQTVPSGYLETMLWLESDRMGFFLDGINQEKFETQRATVKNEKAQNYDNRPYGLVSQYLYRAHYPVGHPYSWLTIGDVADLDRVTVEDLKSFFSTWYQPSNASLVVAGDISPNQVVNWVDAYFGSIPSVGAPPKLIAWVPTLSTTQSIVTVDPRIQLPLVIQVYPTPPRYHVDEPALDAVAFYLGGGPTSLLHQALVRTNLAAAVSAYHYTAELAGEFVITVTPYPSTPIAEIHRVIQTELSKLAATPLSRDALAPFLAKHRVDTLSIMDSVESKADTLVTNATIHGDPGFLAIEARRYQQVTPTLAMKAFNQYIYNKPMTVFTVVPSGHPLAVSGHPTAVNLSSETRVSIDRSRQPLVATPSQTQSLNIWRDTILGVSVVGITDRSAPLVRIRATYSGGDRVLPAGQNGQAALLAGVMMRDTQFRNQQTIQHALESLGGTVTIEANRDGMSVDIVAPIDQLTAVLKIATERIRYPKWVTENVQPIIQQMHADRLAQQSNLESLADQAVLDHVYGIDTVDSRPLPGHGPNLSKVMVVDLQSRHHQLIQSAPLGVSVIGAISRADIRQIVSALSFSTASSTQVLTPTRNAAAVTRAEDPNTIVVVDVPGATQAELRVWMPGMPYDVTGNFYLASLFNYPIGGHFNADINLELRERRGISYGAYGTWTADRLSGYYAVSSAIKGEAVGEAVDAVLHILRQRGQGGVTQSETNELIHSLTQREALRYETQAQRLTLLERIQEYHLPTDMVTLRLVRLNTLTSTELNAVGQPLFSQVPRIVIVGDWNMVAPQLKSFDRPIQRRMAQTVIW